MARMNLLRQKPYKVRSSGGGGGTIVQLSHVAGFEPGDDVWEYLTSGGDLVITKRGDLDGRRRRAHDAAAEVAG